ncbi:metalloregulator ArsR/SmtB family transcription factor [Paenibacillus sp. FSL R10-2782]|uniref:ArsR/SmtB family transcription factor n=1 Tax=Paenibacillus sp. FSL R10-2782 TaxID=2954661 RepID=UPI003158339D
MGKQAIELLRACIPTFQTLSEPHRQDILLLLSENGKMTVNAITEHLVLSRPAVSHHLKLLKNAGVVQLEQRGTEHHYFLALDHSIQLLKNLVTTLERNCL